MPKMQQEPKIAPPSAPMLTLDNEPDDIPDPPLPASLADEAMAQAVPGVPATAPTTAVVPSHGQAPPSIPATLRPPDFGQHEALLHGFCQYLQGKMHDWMTAEHRAVMASLENVYADARAHRETVLQANEHALYALGNTLAKLQEDGLKVHSTPYEMSLRAYSPAGLPLTLTIRQATPQALIDELTRLETWLGMHGYTAEPGREVAA